MWESENGENIMFYPIFTFPFKKEIKMCLIPACLYDTATIIIMWLKLS